MMMRSERGRRAFDAGRAAEALAALFLMAKGYRILARRYRTPVGEIDIVAGKGAAIAFIEVKRRASLAAALEAVRPAARRRIGRAAEWYMNHHAAPGGSRRFDVIAVRPWRLPLHLENAWIMA